MKNRILASVLSLCLMLSLLSVPALASGEEDATMDGTETIETVNNEAGGETSRETDDAAGEETTKLSDETPVTSTGAITRAQMAEMVYEHESLRSDIDTMAGGGTEPNFTDIESCTDDQKTAITALYKAKIISGTAENTFNPTGTVTRGEFAVVLWRATGCRSNKTAMTATFTDTLESWYAPAVNCFYGAGLISGTAQGTFNGGDTIPVVGVNAFLSAYAANKETFINNTNSGSTTRAEMTVEFYEKFQPELSKLAATREWNRPFTDLAGCTDEQVEAIQFFYEREIISGTSETTFHPITPVSNFQIAALLQRCAQKEIPAETTESIALFSVMPLAAENQSPFDFLTAQGVDVGSAKDNPNAPALTATLTTWRDGLIPDAPTFTPESGAAFTETQPVSISAGSEDEEAVIYYTTDGSEPTTGSAQYSEAITISDTTTVKAIVVKNNLVSEITTAAYTKQTQEPDPPALTITATPPSLSGGGTVTLTVSNIPADQTASVVCDNTAYSPAPGADGTWTVSLPNAAATYTFTAAAGTATASCTVSVTYQGGGSSSSGGSGNSSVSGSGDNVSVAVSGSSVSNSQLAKAVEKADEGSVITIDAGSRASVSLPSGGLQDAADNQNDVTIELKSGEVSLSPKALTALVEQAGSTITLTVEPVSTEELNSRQQAAVGDAPVFDLSIKSGGKVISNFGGGLITVSIPHELPDNQDPAGVVVWFMDDDGNISACETMYDLHTKTVIFTTRHFSKYVIGYVEPVNFTDVPADAYYYDAVIWAVAKGVTGGTGETTFSPDASCTRAQMVTFLWRAAGSPKVDDANPFTDAQTDEYYYDAVLWAVERGITSGTSATTFSPDATCTRGQAVTFLYRAAGSPAVSKSNAFSDVAADAYYADAVLWAVAEGITTGTGGGLFSPEADCTRAQIVTFIYRNAT